MYLVLCMRLLHIVIQNALPATLAMSLPEEAACTSSAQDVPLSSAVDVGSPSRRERYMTFSVLSYGSLLQHRAPQCVTIGLPNHPPPPPR